MPAPRMLSTNELFVVIFDGMPEIANFGRFLTIVREWNMRPLHAKIPGMSISEMYRNMPRIYADNSGYGDLTEIMYNVSECQAGNTPYGCDWITPLECPMPGMVEKTHAVRVWMGGDGMGAIHGAYTIWTDSTM